MPNYKNLAKGYCEWVLASEELPLPVSNKMFSEYVKVILSNGEIAIDSHYSYQFQVWSVPSNHYKAKVVFWLKVVPPQIPKPVEKNGFVRKSDILRSPQSNDCVEIKYKEYDF